MNKVRVFCIFLITALTMPAFAEIEVTLSPPEFGGTGVFDSNGLLSSVVDELNGEIGDVFRGFENEIQGYLDSTGIDGAPRKLITAMGTSSLFASNGASQHGYAGYDRFAITIGPMVGMQIPSSPFNIVNEIGDIGDKLLQEGDLEIGVNPQLLTGQFGMNTSKFLIDGLYLGAQFGYMKLGTGLIPDLSVDLSFNAMSLGLRANYQLISQKSLLAKSLLWRGVNLSSGFIFQKTGLNIAFPLDMNELSNDAQINGEPVPISFKPSIDLGLEVNTFTIPLEIMTSIRFLYIMNLSLGLGADLGFGTSKLSVGMNIKDIDIDIDALEASGGFIGSNLAGTIYEKKSGNASISMNGSEAPNLFNMKLMTGIGFSLGPVILDVPITWYFANNGISVGLTMGLVL